MPSDTDAIQKHVNLRAPIERVWQAIGSAEEFGRWFGVNFAGQEFEPGNVVSVTITEPPEYAGLAFTVSIVAVEPPRRLSFRWHPYAVDPAADYSREPTTLIEFVLEPDGDGTLLTVTESGFDGIPEERRAEAFRMNTEGWEQQMEQVRAYVEA